jgi:hypothetical protein
MLIIKIIGGLGNQMFQYAYAKALQERGYIVKIDISSFDTYKLHGGLQLDKYNINLEIATIEEINNFFKNTTYSKILTKININRIIKEKKLNFNKILLNPVDDNYIDGYFQCEKYFNDIYEILIQSFCIKKTISEYTKEIKKQILNQDNSCSLHVRRGDYISDTRSNNIHGTCSLDYYRNAINILNNKQSNIAYFIFSDDIDWVEKNLQIENAIFINSKEKRIPHEDIYLMSLCNHNIIANSSFSWWGAWLNNKDNKIVIAPKRWFSDKKMFNQSNDIIPTSWIKL